MFKTMKYAKWNGTRVVHNMHTCMHSDIMNMKNIRVFSFNYLNDKNPNIFALKSYSIKRQLITISWFSNQY